MFLNKNIVNETNIVKEKDFEKETEIKENNNIENIKYIFSNDDLNNYSLDYIKNYNDDETEKYLNDILYNFKSLNVEMDENNDCCEINETNDYECYNRYRNIDYENFTIKELNAICEYYKIKINKIKKSNIISLIEDFENKTENNFIVKKRKIIWSYLNILKNDKVIKKYILGF